MTADSRRGWLRLNSWAGPSKTLVEIVEETPKRLRIRAIKRMRLAGRDRWLDAGQTALIVKHAIEEFTS